MSLVLVLTHALSIAAGAAAVWAALRLRAVDARPRQTGESATPVAADDLRSPAADRMTLAAEAIGIGLWELDVSTGAVLTDTRMRALLGVDREIDRPFSHVHPDDYQRVLNVIEAAKHDSGAALVSVRHRILRGLEVRHLQSHLRLFRDAHGAPLRLLGVTWDVTAEVEHAQQVQQHADRAQQLLERLSVATQAAGITPWEYDLVGQRFVWVENRIKAVSADDVPVERYHEVLRDAMPPEDLACMSQTIADAIARGERTFSQRFRLIRHDGIVRHMQLFAQIVRNEAGDAIRLLGATSDVTNEVQTYQMVQRQAEHERQLSDRLAMATQAAAISSWEIDLRRGEFLWLENPIRGLEGSLDQTHLSLARHAQAIHEEDRALFTDELRRALREKRNQFSYRYRVTAADGRLMSIQVHARLLPDETTGRMCRVLGVSWDITDEVEAARQLRDAQRRLERASLSSSEGHWEYDVRADEMWYSSSYHALLGYSDGTLPVSTREFEELVHPDDVEQLRCARREHLRRGTAFLCDLRVRCASGDYRWLRTRGTAERDAHGMPTTMSGSVHDIHEQKLAEDALRLVRQRFERAIKGTQDGLWELDACGSAWCSPRVAELLGYGADELAAETNFLREFLHPEDADALANATQSHFQQDLPYDVELRLRTKSGEHRWYRARAMAERDAEGRPLRLSGSLQDVTDARAAREELLRATHAANMANRAKSEFLANMSHEIRTPMNGILGMTGLLLDTHLDRTQRDYAETIRSSADSLLNVINDILDFSKIEAGRLEFETIDMDLRTAVEDVGALMAFQAAAKHLELVIHVHPDVPARVVGDPQRLRQCLINLVGNAIKFTRAGEIVIEVRNAGLDGDRVITQFEVRDTGIGIAPETLNTLFQPFVQADSSTTRHFGGTGLGLSIVRRLVELMGGAVGATSEVGRGSTFWFSVPLPPAAQVAPAKDADLTRIGRRVLVVDDNETNRRVLAGQLMQAGFEVSLASSGVEALAMMRQAIDDEHPIEVVLADHRMQDMDGSVLGERINADSQLSRARIVMLTSVDRHGDIRKFAALGFAGYLTKPVRAQELLDCIDRVLSCEASEWHLQSQPIITRGTLAATERERRYGGRVLLVEDNAVNQKVAVRFLERMGCRVRVADNGAEGVKAFGESRYDLVLMDLQMPVMDGLTATREIRRLEGNATPTPIVALTANAMAGQLERCLEHGMDGFLTKPLELNKLRDTLDRFGVGTHPAPAFDVDSASTRNDVPVDLARLNELTDGDPQFARELTETFIASGTQVLSEIHQAFGAFDRNALSRAAHKLKGASANIHAETLAALAFELESQAGQLDQPRLKELIGRLQGQFERAGQFLEQQLPAPAAKAG